MLSFRDGEVCYRDSGEGESAFLGHSFAEGDDTLKVFVPRLVTDLATNPGLWKITSDEDQDFGTVHPVAVHRRAKPMNTDHTLASELDHTLYLKLPKPMRQGCTYTVAIPKESGSDTYRDSFLLYQSPSPRDVEE